MRAAAQPGILHHRHHRSLTLVSGLLVAAKLTALLFLSLVPASAQLSTITVDRIVQLTNAERLKAGLKPLTVNPLLARAAEQKGEDMLAHTYFAHISPTGVTPWFWMSKVGYKYDVAGENLAIDFTEAEDVVAAWIASPSHKENMLSPDYTETGVAVVTGEFQGATSTIVVHMFGHPLVAEAPVAKAAPTAPVPAPARVPQVKPAHVAILPTALPFDVAQGNPATATPLPVATPPPAPIAALPVPILLSPATDTAQLSAPLPHFNIDTAPVISHAPLYLNQFTRELAAIVFVIVAALLGAATVIRLRLQHPHLIFHSLLVLGIALVVFVF